MPNDTVLSSFLHDPTEYLLCRIYFKEEIAAGDWMPMKLIQTVRLKPPLKGEVARKSVTKGSLRLIQQFVTKRDETMKTGASA